MNTVFLDTVGLLATWDQSDQWHRAAINGLQRIQSANTPTVTTTFVLLECGNAAARRPYRPAVNRLRVVMEDASCLIRPSAEDWDNAWQGYVRGDASGAGIVDHVSFAVMRRLGITQVFSNDRHFSAAGFELLF